MVYTELEELMANRFGREAALLFNSGYHANTGILPALTDKQSVDPGGQTGTCEYHRRDSAERRTLPTLPSQRL